MECVQCGADLPSRARGCLFCGEPFHFGIPLKSPGTPLRWVAAFGILIAAVFVAQCAFSVGYLQTDFLRSEEMKPAIEALAKGQTTQARSSSHGLYRSARYSGFPGAVIAASYYRDYMVSGDSSDLNRMRDYIITAHAVDASFATRYYLGLYLYSQGEYNKAIELASNARAEMTGVTRWAGGVIDRRRWQWAVAELLRAAELGKNGGPALIPVYVPLDAKPADTGYFEVEFAL
jgi:hypothetical protein